jgi:hypothetical protein
MDDVGRGECVGPEREEWGDDAEACNAREEEEDFLRGIMLHMRGRNQGQCHPWSGGQHLHGSAVRAQTCWW